MVRGTLPSMKSFQARIDERVEAFVGDLQGLVWEAASSALEDALPGKGRRKRREKRACARRSHDEISGLVEQLYQEICACPGERMSVLSGKLEQGSGALSFPMRRLVKVGRVKKTGSRQHACYYPVGRHAPRNATGRARKAKG